MSTYTCLSCHVAFSDGDGQRDHFKSDWHRYNLMRKVAGLPPVTKESYNDRVLLAKSQAAKIEAEETDAKIVCKPCKKTFSSRKAFDNHIKSNKHIDIVNRHAEDSGSSAMKIKYSDVQKMQVNNTEEEEDIEIEEVDSFDWDGEPVAITECLFCSHHSANMEKNIKHMTVEHSFFIPDLEYCINLKGLVKYLGEKVGCGFMCLACRWCAKRSLTLDSIQKHMTDKNHCRISLEGEDLLEYAEYYDFSSSYPDAGAGVALDEEVELNKLDGDDFQLVLPSGAVVGHRSLQRYYRQRLNPSSGAVVIRKSQSSTFHSIMLQYRALGWKGATNADILKKKRDLAYMNKLHSKTSMHLGIKNNKNMQHHFRCQNPM